MQGFPRDYVIPQNYTEGVKQVGNSVCPPVAHQIGMALRYQVEWLDEFAVPLIEPDEVLSFDKMKGKRAKKTHEKKVTKVVADNQMSLFDLISQVEYPSEKKHRTFKGHDISWIFENGELLIDIDKKTAKAKAIVSIGLSFFGGVTTTLKNIRVATYAKEVDNGIITLLWNEIHRAISEYTTYDSLMPLYGHFTEPYPKFVIKFEASVECESIEFQKTALDAKYRTKILAFSKFPLKCDDYEEYFFRMRECGFDVRTNATNRTVPLEHFRICYPFTCQATGKMLHHGNKELGGIYGFCEDTI